MEIIDPSVLHEDPIPFDMPAMLVVLPLSNKSNGHQAPLGECVQKAVKLAKSAQPPDIVEIHVEGFAIINRPEIETLARMLNVAAAGPNEH